MIPVKQTYGIITIFRDVKENLFLILQNNNKEGSWSFPKGHVEEDENPKETALRELKEETKIVDIEFLDAPLIHEEYERIKKNGKKFLKSNDYFIGFVNSQKIEKQDKEIYAYKWATYTEALNTFQYESRKKVLEQVKKYLEEYGKMSL